MGDSRRPCCGGGDNNDPGRPAFGGICGGFSTADAQPLASFPGNGSAFFQRASLRGGGIPLPRAGGRNALRRQPYALSRCRGDYGRLRVPVPGSGRTYSD